MAKKTRTPEEQRRIEERIAFVQANPQLSKAEARKRFYVQTRAKELEAQGKPVDRKALRQKFEMGQVTRAGFYTESDIAASQARIRSSANPMPRNNDTGRSNVTPGYTPGVQGGVKVPGQRTGRETGPGTGSFVTGKPSTSKNTGNKQDNSLLARGLRKIGFKTEGLIDLGFSKQDILNRARNPQQLINTYDALMKQGNKRELFGVSSSDIPVFREVQRGVQKKFLSDMRAAESYAASFVNPLINRSKPVQKFFGEKPNLRQAGKFETGMNVVELAAGGVPGKALKVVSKTPGVKQALRAGGALAKPVARKAAPIAAGMGMTDLAPRIAKFGAGAAAAAAPAAATTAAKKGASKAAGKATKAPTTTPTPNTPAPASSTAAKAKKPRTTKSKPAAQAPAPSPQTRAKNAVDANKAARNESLKPIQGEAPGPYDPRTPGQRAADARAANKAARNAGTGRSTEAPTGKAATKPTLPPGPPKQPAPKLSDKAKKPRIDEPARNTGTGRANEAPATGPATSNASDVAVVTKRKRKPVSKIPLPTRTGKAANASKAARSAGTGRATEAPAPPAPPTETPEQTADWWSDRGGRLNTDFRSTGSTVASQEPAAAVQPTRKTGSRKNVELPENLRGKSVALGSEERKAAEEAADALLGRRSKKSTSTAQTKTQMENQAAKPARQPRLPKAKNTGGGRGKAKSIDEITFTNPDKLNAALDDPRFQKMWDDATPAQQEDFRRRNAEVRKVLRDRAMAKSQAAFPDFQTPEPRLNPAPRGEAPSAPAPTQSSRVDTGTRGTGRQTEQSVEFDDMSVGGYEVVERTPPPAPAKKAGKTKKAAPAKKTAPAKKAAPKKREPQSAPEVVTDTLDSRAVQKEINTVEAEIDRIETREKTLRDVRGRGLSEADIDRLDALRIKRDKLNARLANFNQKVQKGTDRAARIGGTRD